MTVFSPRQIAGALANAGFPDSEIPTGVQIALAESGGNSDATGTSGPGEYSVGPFQINLGQGGHSANINEAQGRDLQGAANYAYQLWAGRGGNWGDWSTYNNGSYLMAQPPIPDAQTQPGGPDTDYPTDNLLPTQIPGIYLNPHTGATIDLRPSSQSGGRGPTITGSRYPDVMSSQAPNWVDAGKLMLTQYEDAVAAGSKQHDAALEEFKSALDKARYMNEDIRLRQTAEAGRQVNLAQEAGTRAQTVARDILPNALPNMQALNLPMIGRVPLSQVNTDYLFNQGLPPLAQTQGIPQTPATPYPEMNLPPITMPQMPNMGPYAQGAAAGFPGYQVPGFPGYRWPD